MGTYIRHFGTSDAVLGRGDHPINAAHGPNQVWSWDITHLPREVKGERYYLYVLMDVYNRKIVAAEVREVERGEDAAALLLRAVIMETAGIAD